MRPGRPIARALTLAVLRATAGSSAAPGTSPPLQPTGYRDGHSRPRALAFNPDDGLLYVASAVDNAT